MENFAEASFSQRSRCGEDDSPKPAFAFCSDAASITALMVIKRFIVSLSLIAGNARHSNWFHDQLLNSARADAVLRKSRGHCVERNTAMRVVFARANWRTR